MTDRIKSLRNEYPSRIPISAGILPAAWMKHRDALDAIVSRHPVLFGKQGDQRNYDAVCKGKVCVDLDLDRQKFPFWSHGDIDAHVREAVETLGSPEGGLWLKVEIGDDVPLENVEAICSALEKYSTYYSTGQTSA